MIVLIKKVFPKSETLFAILPIDMSFDECNAKFKTFFDNHILKNKPEIKIIGEVAPHINWAKDGDLVKLGEERVYGIVGLESNECYNIHPIGLNK